MPASIKFLADLQAVAIGATNLMFTMLAMSVIDRLGRKTLLLIGSVGTAACLGRRRRHLLQSQPPESSCLAAGRLHCLLRIFSGRGYLGFHQRGFPQSRPGERPESGQFFSLVHECAHFRNFSAVGSLFRRIPICFFSLMMALQFFVVLFVYPETKGVSLEQMQKKLGIA